MKLHEKDAKCLIKEDDLLKKKVLPLKIYIDILMASIKSIATYKTVIF